MKRVLIPALVFTGSLSLAGCAQQQPAAQTAAGEFDRRDLSGFWLRVRSEPNEHPP